MMNPTSPTAGTYNPTPMEQAYGLYLLEQVFPTSLASFKANTTIQISGKDAVAFLSFKTSSNRRGRMPSFLLPRQRHHECPFLVNMSGICA